jgi:hypothetical protein
LAAVVWSFTSCITDHDQLAKQSGNETDTATGVVGSGGVGGTAPLLDGGQSTGGAFTASNTTGPMFEFDEDGPDELTLIHGQVDAERIAFCFAPVEEGVPGRPKGEPFPAGGLEFGHHVTTSTPGGLSFENDSIQPIVLAGDLESIAGEDCADAVARASWVDSSVGAIGAAGAAGAGGIGDGLHAMALPQLPSGSLTLGRRYLLAVVGCMTSAENAGVDYAGRCGVPRSWRAPTLAPVLVTASRETRSDRVGLQVLHASAGSDPIALEVFASSVGDSPALRIATDLVFGELFPPTPNLNMTADELGARTGGNVHVFHNGARALQVSWSELAEAADIDELNDGESYVLVLLGPRAGSDEGGGYQGTRLALIRSSETLSGD